MVQITIDEQDLNKDYPIAHAVIGDAKAVPGATHVAGRLPLTLPAPPEPGTRHARHIYAVRVTPQAPLDRDELMAALHRRRIGTGVHYTALHLQPYYRRAYGCRPGDLPQAEAIGRTTLSLPLSAGMSGSDARDVVSALREVLARPQAQQGPRRRRPFRRLA